MTPQEENQKREEIRKVRKAEYKKLFDAFVERYHREPSVRWVRKTYKQVMAKFPEPIYTPPAFLDDDEDW